MFKLKKNVETGEIFFFEIRISFKQKIKNIFFLPEWSYYYTNFINFSKTINLILIFQQMLI